MEDLLAGNQPSDTADCYETTEGLAAPLLACYWSLWDCGACPQVISGGLQGGANLLGMSFRYRVCSLGVILSNPAEVGPCARTRLGCSAVQLHLTDG